MKKVEVLEWHELKDNPDDLPKKFIGTIYEVVLNQDFDKVVYWHKEKVWKRLITGEIVPVDKWARMPEKK